MALANEASRALRPDFGHCALVQLRVSWLLQAVTQIRNHPPVVILGRAPTHGRRGRLQKHRRRSEHPLPGDRSNIPEWTGAARSERDLNSSATLPPGLATACPAHGAPLSEIVGIPGSSERPLNGRRSQIGDQGAYPETGRPGIFVPVCLSARHVPPE